MSYRVFGADIANISTNVSWNSGGTCNLTLVGSPRFPPVGSPAYVQIGGFYFGGILQRWTYKESVSSGRTYDVVIESPTKLLDGIQVILSDFNGVNFSSSDPFDPSNGPQFTNQIYNVYNVYAHMENYQYGGQFGSSNVNSAGFPARLALQLIQTISYGRSSFGGPARFGNSYFNIDFSNIIGSVGNNVRLKGPVQSVSSILQELGEVCGFDYYADVSTNNAIRIFPVFKNAQPNIGWANTYINSQKSSGILISSTIGYEYASPVTQTLVVGGPASRYGTYSIDDTFPVWGKLNNNNYIFDPYARRSFDAYTDPAYEIPIALDEYSSNLDYTATLFEVRMAMGGKDCWETFKILETISGVEPNGYNDMTSAPWVGKCEFAITLLGGLASGSASGIDLEPSSAEYLQRINTKSQQELSDKIYGAVSRVANNYIGQVFAVELASVEPGGTDNNFRFIVDDIQYESQWEIADSAYTELYPFADVSFYDNGRLKSTVSWSSVSYPNIDFSALGGDWAVTPDGDGIATHKCSIDKDLRFFDGVYYAIFRTNACPKFLDSLSTPDYGLSVLLNYFFGVSVNPAAYLSGGQNTQVSIPPAPALPTTFGVPEQSNTYSWGPWWSWSSGFPAKSEVIFDESLVPETFGNFTDLNNAAFAISSAGQAQSVAAEDGVIELVGVPAFNIATRFGGGGPYVSSIDINVAVDSVTTTYKFNSWTPNFGRATRAEVDRIKTARKGVLALAQRNRSFITKRPLPAIKFEKSEFGELAQKHTEPSVNMMHSFINNIGKANLF